MATPIYLRSSAVASKVPTTTTLALRELGANTTDGKLYLRQGTGLVSDIIIPVNIWNASTGGTTAYNTYFTAGNVGIGKTNPTYNLDVSGTAAFTSISVGSTISFGTVFDTIGYTATTTSTSQATVVSLSSTIYRAAEYTIQTTRGTNYKISKVVLIHDGTTPTISEQDIISIGVDPASYDASISGGNILLLATPTSATSTKFQIAVNAFKI
jgi:hypothetical protein